MTSSKTTSLDDSFRFDKSCSVLEDTVSSGCFCKTAESFAVSPPMTVSIFPTSGFSSKISFDDASTVTGVGTATLGTLKRIEKKIRNQ